MRVFELIDVLKQYDPSERAMLADGTARWIGGRAFRGPAPAGASAAGAAGPAFGVVNDVEARLALALAWCRTTAYAGGPDQLTGNDAAFDLVSR